MKLFPTYLIVNSEVGGDGITRRIRFRFDKPQPRCSRLRNRQFVSRQVLVNLLFFRPRPVQGYVKPYG